MKKFLLGLLLLAAWQHSLLAQTGILDSTSLDNYIRQGMKDWEIPGLAIVIVKDGKVVTMKGYGVRDLDKKEPVDENTLFMIASNTKLFTATALANLEYQSKLSLDDPITKYYPDYALYDPKSSALVTIRDLLSHRIGTKTFEGDFTFWNSQLTREQIMHKMRLLKPVNRFRQEFGYCNSCFMTAGQIIPKVTGTAWENYVQDNFLRPLEMNRSTTISSKMSSLDNAARPYSNVFSVSLHRVPYDNWDNLGPAASIISCVSDLSHWLQFQLDSGRYNGQQVFPFAVLQKTRDVNTVVSSRNSRMFPVHFRGYGLGVFTGDYNGRQIYWHTGGAGGMLSNVCFVPEERLGIAILTNNDNQSFFEALRYQVLDAYLAVPNTNRSAQFLEEFRKDTADQLERIASWIARVKGAQPPMSLSSYAGEYDNPVYGPISVATKDDHLEIVFKGHAHLTAQLDYMDKNEWLMRYNNIEYGIFSTKFKTNGSQVKSFEVKMNEFVELDPYTFTKKQ